jgi:WD40 repeat protein
MCSSVRLFKHVVALFFVSTSFSVVSPAYSKTIQLQPVIPLRPIPVRNIEFSPDGKFLAVPNLITAGSIGIFTVSEESKISSLPSRVRERDFYRVAGVSYFANPKKNAPALIYLNLPELMSGYTVAFSPDGKELAVSGGDKITMYSTNDWKQSRTITMGRNANRCIFSPDGKHLAALADGQIYIIETSMYNVRATIEPATNHLFADMTFNADGSIIATLEYRNIVMDHVPRVRLFSTINGDIERELPENITR